MIKTKSTMKRGYRWRWPSLMRLCGGGHWTRHRGRRMGGAYTAWRTAILALFEETWSIAVIGATAAVPKSKNICPI
jgi:hypothetical protein